MSLFIGRQRCNTTKKHWSSDFIGISSTLVPHSSEHPLVSERHFHVPKANCRANVFELQKPVEKVLMFCMCSWDLIWCAKRVAVDLKVSEIMKGLKRIISQIWLKVLGIRKNENHLNGNINVLLFQFDISHYCYLEFFVPNEDCIS